MNEKPPKWLPMTLFIDWYKFSEDVSPYELLRNREWDDISPIEPKFMRAILAQWFEEGDPPPKEILRPLIYDLELAIRGYPSILFRRPEGLKKPLKHPMAVWMEHGAVSYILHCKRYDWDNTPVNTISNVCKVNRSTVYRWVSEYPSLMGSVTDRGAVYLAGTYRSVGRG